MERRNSVSERYFKYGPQQQSMALPSGARKMVVLDSNGQPIKSFEIPEQDQLNL